MEMKKMRLIGYLYDTLPWYQKAVTWIQLAIFPHYKKSYSELKNKLTLPSPPPPDRDLLWEKITSRLENRQSPPFPGPREYFTVFRPQTFAVAGIIIAICTLFLVFRPAAEKMAMTVSPMGAGTKTDTFSLPAENREIVSGLNAVTIKIPPHVDMTILPRSRLMVRSLSWDPAGSHLDGKLTLMEGGLYVHLDNGEGKGGAPGENSKISWTINTPAGTVKALGTTFFVSLGKGNKTSVFLKEGTLEIDAARTKTRLGSPGCGGIDGEKGTWIPVNDNESRRLISSIFPQIEGAIASRSTDGMNAISDTTRAASKEIFSGNEPGEKIRDTSMPGSPLYKIHLTNGMVLIGELTRKASGENFLKTEEGTFTIKSDEIKKIEKIR